MKDWKQGERHPDSSIIAFANSLEMDILRKRIKSRCMVCDITIPLDAREIVFECEKGKCRCETRSISGIKAHSVCEVCNEMYRAIYVNYQMADRNYFKDLDKKDRERDNRRRD